MDRFAFLSYEADFSSPQVVSAYDELPLWSAMFGLLLLDEVPLAGVRAALDVGCGTGFPLIELAERLGPEVHVHGIDPWKAALGRAAEKIACRSTPNVTLHEGSAAAMPFADGSFNLVVSNLGLNNFDDPDAAIGECHRVARTGGVLALTTNLQGHMRELYEIFEDVLRDAGENERLDRLRLHVEHRATVTGLRALLEAHGFGVTRVMLRNGSMRFRDGTALLNHYFIRLGFLGEWKKVAAGREREILGALLERLDVGAGVGGELRLTIPMAYVQALAL